MGIRNIKPVKRLVSSGRPTVRALLAALVIILAAFPCQARTSLVALPDRQSAVINLDNPAATLIEEERVLTLQAGVNRIDFSWKGVSIDPDSIRLQPLSHPDGVTLLNVSYPPDEDALVWEISSSQAGEEAVRISYLLSGIDRLVAYRLTADKAEKQAALSSYLILRNFSGEDFKDARLMLGDAASLRTDAAHEETLQLLMLDGVKTAIRKVWTFDAAKTPWDPAAVDGNVGIPVSYKIDNTRPNGLGEAALHAGKARVYQEDGKGGVIFLGEDHSGVVPVGEPMSISIGDSRDIVVTQRKMQEKRLNVKRNHDNQIVLYDMEETITARIENFKDQPAMLTMMQYIPGYWEMMDCNMDYQKKDSETLQFEVELPAAGVRELTMHYIRKNLRP